MSHTVKIRHAGFIYHQKNKTIAQNGEKIESWNQVMAYRGNTVTLEQEDDYQRGLANDAFWTKDFEAEGSDYSGAPKGLRLGAQFDDSQVEFSEDLPDVDNDSDEALALWVGEHTAAQVLDLATSPDRAARLAEAEENVTGRDPRKGLMTDLEKIVGS